MPSGHREFGTTAVRESRAGGGAGLRGRLDFVFSENGVHAFRGARMLHCKSLADQLGAARWSEFQARLDSILVSCRAEAQQLGP